MEKTNMVMLISFTIILVACGSADLSTYASATGDFSVKYSSAFEQVDDAQGVEVLFLSTINDGSSAFNENLNVIVRDGSGLNLQEYTDSSMQEISKSYPDAVVLESTPSKLSGVAAHEVTYVSRYEDLSIIWKQRWTVINNKVYVLTYTGEVSKRDLYDKHVTDFFESFKVH